MSRGKVIKGLVREIGIVGKDPRVEVFLEFKRIVPVIDPNQIFLEGTKKSFCVSVAFGVVPRGKDLFDFELRTGLHKGLGSGLAAIVRDNFWLSFVVQNTLRKTGIYSHD